MEQSFFAAANDLDNVLDEFERNEDFQLGQGVDFATAKSTTAVPTPQTSAPTHWTPDTTRASFYPPTTGEGARTGHFQPAAIQQHPPGGTVYNGGNYSNRDNGMAGYTIQNQVKEHPSHSEVNGPTGQPLGMSAATNYQPQAGLANYQTTGGGFHGYTDDYRYQGQPGMNSYQGQVGANNLQGQQALSSYQPVTGQNNYSVQGGVTSFQTQPTVDTYQPRLRDSSFQSQVGLNSYPVTVGLDSHTVPGVQQGHAVRPPDVQLLGTVADSHVRPSVPAQPTMSLHGGAYPIVGRSSSPPKPVNLQPEAQVPSSAAMVHGQYPLSSQSANSSATISGGGQGVYPVVPASTGLYPQTTDITQPSAVSDIGGLYPSTTALPQMANNVTGTVGGMKGNGLYPQTSGLQQASVGAGIIDSTSLYPGISTEVSRMPVYPSIGNTPVTTDIQAQVTADELTRYMMTSRVLKKDTEVQPSLSTGVNPAVSSESTLSTANTIQGGPMTAVREMEQITVASSSEGSLRGNSTPQPQNVGMQITGMSKTVKTDEIVQDPGLKNNTMAPSELLQNLEGNERENKSDAVKAAELRQEQQNVVAGRIVPDETVVTKVEMDQPAVTAAKEGNNLCNVNLTAVVSDSIKETMVAPEQVKTQETMEDTESCKTLHSESIEQELLSSGGDGNRNLTEDVKITSKASKINVDMQHGAIVKEKGIEQTEEVKGVDELENTGASGLNTAEYAACAEESQASTGGIRTGKHMIGFTTEADVEEEFSDSEIDAYLGLEGIGVENSRNEAVGKTGREENAGMSEKHEGLELVIEKPNQEVSATKTSISQPPVTLFLPTESENKKEKSDIGVSSPSLMSNKDVGKADSVREVPASGELSDADPFFNAQASTSPTDMLSLEGEEEEGRSPVASEAKDTTAPVLADVKSILESRTNIQQHGQEGNSESLKEGLEKRVQIENANFPDLTTKDDSVAGRMATGVLDHGDGLKTAERAAEHVFSALGFTGKSFDPAAVSRENPGNMVTPATETERMLGLPVDIKATMHQQGTEGQEQAVGGNPVGGQQSSAGAHGHEDGTNPPLHETPIQGESMGSIQQASQSQPRHTQQPQTGHAQQPQTGHAQQPQTLHAQQPQTGHAHQPQTGHAQQPQTGHAQQPSQTEDGTEGDGTLETAIADMSISGQMEDVQEQTAGPSEMWDTRQAPSQDMPEDGVRMPPHPPLGVASPEDVGFPPNVEMFRDDLSSVLPSDIGWEAPVWVPDEDAPNCMKCEAKFTFTKRRHHCRACGKVLCSACCSQKARLAYMDNKSARVCSTCYNILQRAQARGQIAGISQVTPSSGQASPNPNNPMEYCSTVPPIQQAQEALQRPPPSVLVPVGGRPQGPMGIAQREGRHVRFSDGSFPGGGDATSDSSTPSTPSHPITTPTPAHPTPTPQGAAAVRPRSAPNTSPQHKGSPSTTAESRARLSPSKNRGQPSERQSGSPRHGGSPRKTGSPKSPPRSRQSAMTKSLIPEEDDRLPPVILSIGDKGDYEVDWEPYPDRTLADIKREETDPVMFLANPNLVVLVKVINLSCCVNRLCWCFTTRGMHTVSQDEVVILLEAMPDDDAVPRDIFAHLQMVYEEAGKGNTVGDLGHTIFNQPFLGSREHGGFLYIQPTFQCTQRLILPEPPYVVGVLLQKWETPWAKVFPIRLMLRLGAEFRYYPCPLFSVRFRKPVYCEIGHTIMNLLADFRNYQYMLGQVRGVVILLEDKRTLVRIPSNRYDDMMKVLNNCNEHVLSWGSNFSEEADSHLVCIQNDEGAYQTQAISIQNRPRKVTGASFIVFNGSLKTTAGLRAKSSIVEDGVMVQILPETMAELRQALRNMKDYTIGCGSTSAEEPDETVEVRWVEDDRKMNIGVTSPIDGQSMEGLTNIHVHSGMDFAGEHRTIRWTEVFFLQTEDSMPQCEPMELSRLAESIATATCVALVQHLDSLKEAGMNKLGLRVNIDRDEVGYVAGSKGQFLPPLYMTDLDNELIPVIHNAAASNQDTPIRLELIFHILHNAD